MNAFQVLTEFKFEVGGAIASSKALQDQVGKLSSAADQALLAFQKLSFGIISQMGIGSGGILGALYQAVNASDKFMQSQLGFANIIIANAGHAVDFQDAMFASADAMERIRKASQQFSLPASSMTDMTKLVGAALINKGLDDSSFAKSIDLSRSFLKSAPVLGVDPQLATGQLMDSVSGRASMADTFFQRLVNETAAMKEFAGSPQKFNALEPAKRLKVLTTALDQFSSNINITTAQARSLSGEMTRLRDSLSGTYSILKPIGDVILNSFLPVLSRLNDYLGKEGMEISKKMASILKPFIESPEQMLVTTMQLRKMKEDLGQAGNIVKFAGITEGIVFGLTWLVTGSLKAIPIVGWLAAAFATLTVAVGEAFPVLQKILIAFGALAGLAALLYSFPSLVKVLAIAFKSFILPLAIIYGFLQLLSRAAAYAKIEDAKDYASSMENYVRVIRKAQIAFGFLINPIRDLWDGAAKLIAPLFKMSFWVNLLVSLLESVSDMIVHTIALFQALFNVIVQGVINVINDLASVFGMGNNYAGQTMSINEAFADGINSIMDQYTEQINQGKAISNTNQYINKVEIKNQFKENLEPDRIAFTLRDQLLKVATNPNSAPGKSFRAAGATSGW